MMIIACFEVRRNNALQQIYRQSLVKTPPYKPEDWTKKNKDEGMKELTGGTIQNEENAQTFILNAQTFILNVCHSTFVNCQIFPAKTFASKMHVFSPPKCLGTKGTLNTLPTLPNNEPVPQVLKQVVNLSCSFEYLLPNLI